MSVQIYALDSFEFQQYFSGVGAWLYDPVILKCVGFTAVNEINSRIDFVELHPAKILDTRPPVGRIAALEVVAFDKLPIEALRPGCRISADHLHSDHFAAGLEDRFGGGEK